MQVLKEKVYSEGKSSSEKRLINQKKNLSMENQDNSLLKKHKCNYIYISMKNVLYERTRIMISL